MKKMITNTRKALAVLLVIMLPGYCMAQATDTLPESAYTFQPPKHIINLYNGPLPYIVFGVVIALLAYGCYRYWRDNVSDDITHTPHHQ